MVSESLRDNILLGVPEHVVGLDRVVHAAVLSAICRTSRTDSTRSSGHAARGYQGGQVQRVAAARMFARPAEL
ncbi:MAG: hypothetical protein LC797_19935 [Chloroflexi bacterium]|nr:hypothetical protein [Chloroflexota bacterium]